MQSRKRIVAYVALIAGISLFAGMAMAGMTSAPGGDKRLAKSVVGGGSGVAGDGKCYCDCKKSTGESTTEGKDCEAAAKVCTDGGGTVGNCNVGSVPWPG